MWSGHRPDESRLDELRNKRRAHGLSDEEAAELAAISEGRPHFAEQGAASGSKPKSGVSSHEPHGWWQSLFRGWSALSVGAWGLILGGVVGTAVGIAAIALGKEIGWVFVIGGVGGVVQAISDPWNSDEESGDHWSGD